MNPDNDQYILPHSLPAPRSEQTLGVLHLSCESGYHTGVKALRTLLLAALVLGLDACERGSKPRMIGSAAPEFTLKDSDHTVSLRELRGKPVVLNFWAAHCQPCVDEMPSLVQLQKRMGQRVTVVGVGVDTTEADYRSFLRDYQIDFLTVLDPEKESYTRYGATGYPETFIIDASGVIRRKFVGPENWTSPEIIEYLNKL